MASSELKVIIVGGSIAGLTLAHFLERAGIKYVVLEKGSNPAPQVGASIGILPNGARILDQLQLYDEVESHIEPLETATMCYPDGFTFHSSYPKLIHQRSVWSRGGFVNGFALLLLTPPGMGVGLDTQLCS